MESTNAELRRAFPTPLVVGLVAVHACLVPIAIAATRLWLGFEDRLTWLNQFTWWPIILAQGTLLAIYLAWGGSRLGSRIALFFSGSVYTTCSYVWAQTMLESFAEPKLRWIFNWWQIMILPLMTPQLMMGGALAPFRRWMGSIQRTPDSRPAGARFRIGHLLLVMTLTALIAALVAPVVSSPGFAQMIEVRWILVYATWGMLDAAGLTILALGCRRRWVGLLLMLGSAAMQIALLDSRFESAPYVLLRCAYSWCISLGTLLVLRLGGYRLRGGWANRV